MAEILPPEVGYPTIVAHGGGRGEDWLVQERQPGRPLAHVWPTLTDGAAREGGRSASPSGSPRSTAPRRRPTSRRSSTPRSSSRSGAADPTRPGHRGARPGRQARARRSRAVRRGARPGDAAGPDDHPVRVRRRSCTATSPSRTSCGTTTRSPRCSTSSGPGPGRRDLDLDILLRCAAYPHLHVARGATCRRHARRGLRRGAVVARRGLPEPVRVPAPDRPGADLLDRLRRARPARRAADRRRRATSPSSTPTTASSGWCTARATSTSSAAAASARSSTPAAGVASRSQDRHDRPAQMRAGMAWWSRVDGDQVGVERARRRRGRSGPRTSASPRRSTPRRRSSSKARRASSIWPMHSNGVWSAEPEHLLEPDLVGRVVEQVAVAEGGVGSPRRAGTPGSRATRRRTWRSGGTRAWRRCTSGWPAPRRATRARARKMSTSCTGFRTLE